MLKTQMSLNVFITKSDVDNTDVTKLYITNSYLLNPTPYIYIYIYI